MADYAKVTVLGTPISKSNFKLVNKDGRTFMPQNTGSYHDRYAQYEEDILIACKNQCPNIVFNESLIAILKVFYKSSKRHPDTNNITKSIFDGVEKSGLIINDAQIRRLVIEEYYDVKNPRFELELFKESVFNMTFEVRKNEITRDPITYNPPPNYKGVNGTNKLLKEFEEERKKSKTEDNFISDSKKIKEKILSNPLNVEDEIKKIKESANNKLSLGSTFSNNKLNISDLKGFEDRIKNSNQSKKPVSDKKLKCSICKKLVSSNSCITADKGKTVICNSCLKKNL